MTTRQADYYMVQVNLGSSDQIIIPLYREKDFNGYNYVSDPSFGVCETEEYVRKGLVETHGRITFFAETLKQAEDVQTGIDMVRKMLRGWIDS